MGKHLDGRRNVSLATAGMEEGKEEEAKYEGVRGELNDKKQRSWWEEKLAGIKEEKWKWTFGEVYCSREEGLVCSEGKCRSLGMRR
jgi:hypothetical protein